jgi:hypothetical protein
VHSAVDTARAYAGRAREAAHQLDSSTAGTALAGAADALLDGLG